MQSTGNSSGVPSAPRVPAKHSWLWFFLLLAAAGVFAVVTPLIYNLRQQLQPEQLEAARERWKQNGPRDYDLMWEVKQYNDQRPDEYHVVVRDGKVWVVQANRDVWLAEELATPLGGAVGPNFSAAVTERLPQHGLTGYTVEAQFQTIEENLRKNAESGGMNFATAAFDKTDGHPLRYIYRVRHTPERLEWNVKLIRP
jgi:hypothetical protein